MNVTLEPVLLAAPLIDAAWYVQVIVSPSAETTTTVPGLVTTTGKPLASLTVVLNGGL